MVRWLLQASVGYQSTRFPNKKDLIMNYLRFSLLYSSPIIILEQFWCIECGKFCWNILQLVANIFSWFNTVMNQLSLFIIYYWSYLRNSIPSGGLQSTFFSLTSFQFVLSTVPLDSTYVITGITLLANQLWVTTGYYETLSIVLAYVIIWSYSSKYDNDAYKWFHHCPFDFVTTISVYLLEKLI